MHVTETLHDGLKRGWTVVVPQADIEGKRTKRLLDLAKTLNLPGFRPGKVPANLVRQRYGTAVTAEVLEESVQSATQQVLDDRGLRAAMQPKVDVVNADPAKDLEFKVEVELLPEITMPQFDAMHLTRLTSEPTAEAVDKALENLASRQRDLVAVEEERGAERGETLTVDFTGKRDGEPFAGGSATDMKVEVGGTGFIPGFSEQLEGMKAGEDRVISVSFPDDYHAKDLAGAAVTFDVKAKALSKPLTPTMDDAFAEKLGMDSMEELRKAITDVIQREYDGMSRMRLKRELLDHLAKGVDFQVPPSMVDAEFGQIWARVESDRKSGQGDEEDKGKDEDTLKAEYRAIAERRVRLGLLLAEIGRVNGIQVGQDEVTRAMRTEAARYRGQEQQVMEFYRKNPQAADALRGPIFEEKVVDFVLELAKVENKPVSVDELSVDPGATLPDAVTEPSPVPEAAA